MSRARPQLVSPAPWLATLVALSFVLATTSPAGAQQAPEVPQQAVAAAQADLSAEIGVPVEQIELARFVPVTWSDGCLGVERPGEACTQALVEGHVIWLRVEDEAYRYHTDEEGMVVLLAEGPIPVADVDEAPIPEDARVRQFLDGGGASPAPPATGHGVSARVEHDATTWALAGVLATLLVPAVGRSLLRR